MGLKRAFATLVAQVRVLFRTTPGRSRPTRPAHPCPSDIMAQHPLDESEQTNPPPPPPWLPRGSYTPVFASPSRPWSGHMLVPLDFDPLAIMGLTPAFTPADYAGVLVRNAPAMILSPGQGDAERLLACRLRLAASILRVPSRRRLCEGRPGRLAVLVNTWNIAPDARHDLPDGYEDGLDPVRDPLALRQARRWNELWNLADRTHCQLLRIVAAMESVWAQWARAAALYLSPAFRTMVEDTTKPFVRPRPHFSAAAVWTPPDPGIPGSPTSDAALLAALGAVWHALQCARRLLAESAAVIDLLFVLAFRNRVRPDCAWLAELGEDPLLQLPCVLAATGRKVGPMRNYAVVCGVLLCAVGRAGCDAERWAGTREFVVGVRWDAQDTMGYQAAVRRVVEELGPRRVEELGGLEREARADLRGFMGRLVRAGGAWPEDEAEWWTESLYLEGQKYGLVIMDEQEGWSDGKFLGRLQLA